MNLAVAMPRKVLNINPINDYEFYLFKGLVYRQIGIDLRVTKKAMLESRLQSRLVHHDMSNFGDYFQLLHSEPEEMKVMLDLLTTNETFFFRENNHFEFLKAHVLPELRSSNIRVWSGACSSGEEVYSLAMVLDDHLLSGSWELIGSDVSHRMIEKARGGHYIMQRHEGIPDSFLKRYCLRGVGSQDGTLLIRPELRNRISFQNVNLKNPLPNLGHFDVIFLRNVLIYFDQQTKGEIVERVAMQLKSGGYLFISHTENLQGIDVPLKMVRPSIFRRC